MFRRIFIGLTAVLAAGAWIFFGWNRFYLEVIPVGEPSVVLEYGEEFADPGVQMLLKGTKFLTEGVVPDAELTVSGQVQEERTGRYVLDYEVSYFWLQGYSRRVVSVIDSKPPMITLIADPKEIPVPYEESGYYAFDEYDGDITDKVIRIESMGLITYAVADSSGNPAYVERQVPFHDPIPPEIVLDGGTDFRIPAGKPYFEPGWSATDNVDGDMTAKVTAEGAVNWLVPGVYPIRYSVTDAYENTTEVIRHVKIVAADRPEVQWPEGKTIYLTFDDGPSPHTKRLLDVLDRYNVKATFFVVDSEYNEIMQDIVDRGHSIGIHSVTHDYAGIYASPEAYFEDLYAMQQIIYDHTGVMTTLMRFPGGSSNTVSIRSCKGIMSFLTEAVQDAGFQYFDWNVDSGDTTDARKKNLVIANVKQRVEEAGIAMVLQHDIHSFSVDAVEEIVRWGLDNGYTFLPLTENTPGFHQPVNN